MRVYPNDSFVTSKTPCSNPKVNNRRSNPKVNNRRSNPKVDFLLWIVVQCSMFTGWEPGLNP